MSYHMNDVRLSDGPAIAAMAKDPRFFYVYINDGGQNPTVGGLSYAALCETVLQARLADKPSTGLLSKAGSVMRGAFRAAVDANNLTDAWAKGLRDEAGNLKGLTILMQNKDGKTEIGYFLHPDLHGKGLATSMVMSTLDWARKNTGLTTLLADVDPANGASCGILKKLGLQNTEYHEIGKYKDPDKKPIPSQIMEGGVDAVDRALATYKENNGVLFPVTDLLLDGKRRQAPTSPAATQKHTP